MDSALLSSSPNFYEEMPISPGHMQTQNVPPLLQSLLQLQIMKSLAILAELLGFRPAPFSSQAAAAGPADNRAFFPPAATAVPVEIANDLALSIEPPSQYLRWDFMQPADTWSSTSALSSSDTGGSVAREMRLALASGSVLYGTRRVWVPSFQGASFTQLMSYNILLNMHDSVYAGTHALPQEYYGVQLQPNLDQQPYYGVQLQPNLDQQPYRAHTPNNTTLGSPNSIGSSANYHSTAQTSRLFETLLPMFGQVITALLTMFNNRNSESPSTRFFWNFTVGCTTAGFFSSLYGLLVSSNNSPDRLPFACHPQAATRSMGLIASVATAFGFIGALCMSLPNNVTLWVTAGLACAACTPMITSIFKPNKDCASLPLVAEPPLCL